MLESLTAWVAPIVSALVICAGQLALNRQFKRSEDRRKDERRRQEMKVAKDESWRESVTARLDRQEAKIDDLLASQCSQIRSDIVHKAHRYLDDMGCASTEEKRSLYSEYEDYLTLCQQAGVENNLIDRLVARIVDLPEREL